MMSCGHAPSGSKLHACNLELVFTQGVRQRRPLARVNSPMHLRWTSFHGVPALTIPMPIFLCNESPGCYIRKSISLYLSKFILSKILSSLWSLSLIDMLRSIVKVCQQLTHNSLTQALSRYFLQSLPHATSQATPL